MNAFPSFDPQRLADANLGAASKAFGEAAENWKILTDSLVTGVQASERVRAELLATSVKGLQQQAASVAALAGASGPEEALELQKAVAREALEGYGATIKAFSGVAAAWTEAFKPLTARFAGAVLAASDH